MTQENMNKENHEKLPGGTSLKEKCIAGMAALVAILFIAFLAFFFVIGPYLNRQLLDATWRGDIARMQQMIRFGASVNTVNRNGFTPLVQAVRANRNLDVLRVLIDSGANVNAVDNLGYTPLMHAARDSSGMDAMGALINMGVDINTLVESHQAVSNVLFAATSTLMPGAVQLLLDSGADVSIRNAFGKNALYYAESNRSLLGTDAFNRLREKTFVNLLPTKDRETATEVLLSVAGVAGAEEVLWLVQHGADINAVDAEGRTPLMRATRLSRSPATVIALIESGADVSMKCDDGKNARSYARENRNLWRDGFVSDAYSFLREETLSNVSGHEATLALVSLVVSASAEQVTRLIHQGADVNFLREPERAPSHGRTALIRAARWSSDTDVLQVLIEHGADVNVANNVGLTPLMHAASSNRNPDILRFLIEHGANVNVADTRGRTALMRAAQYTRSLGVIELLLDNGADASMKCDEGKNALDYSTERRNINNLSRRIYRLLRERMLSQQ